MANRLWVGTKKGLFGLTRTQHHWSIDQVHFLGAPVSAVLSDRRDGAIYAALNHGHFGQKLHRSDDGGKSFQELTAPAYPQDAKDPTSVDQIWALEAGHSSEPGALWAGTIPGGLFHSQDRGLSWRLVRSLWDHEKRKEWFGGGTDKPGIHSICVHPQDARKLSLAVSCGGVWFTEDGGETWEARTQGMYAAFMPPERREDPYIQDVHRLVQCRTAPDCFWAQHHNAAFKSTDAGRTWQDLTHLKPSSFGFGVVVHPDDPGTAWFVPAQSDELRVPVSGKVVVARTRNGGESFEVLTRGLPQEHAYDLTYRHALDIDGEGDTVAFGSTTGSLWISGDGGEAWWSLSTHLPPIHVVRFQ